MACSKRIAPADARASFPRGPSYASAKTPPTKVRRNGWAQSQGELGTATVIRTKSRIVVSSGAVFPK